MIHIGSTGTTWADVESRGIDQGAAHQAHAEPWTEGQDEAVGKICGAGSGLVEFHMTILQHCRLQCDDRGQKPG